MVGDVVRYADESGRDYRGTVTAEHADRSVDLVIVADGTTITKQNVPHRSARIKPKEFKTGMRDPHPKTVTLPAREPGEFWTE